MDANPCMGDGYWKCGVSTRCLCEASCTRCDCTRLAIADVKCDSCISTRVFHDSLNAAVLSLGVGPTDGGVSSLSVGPTDGVVSMGGVVSLGGVGVTGGVVTSSTSIAPLCLRCLVLHGINFAPQLTGFLAFLGVADCVLSDARLFLDPLPLLPEGGAGVLDNGADDARVLAVEALVATAGVFGPFLDLVAGDGALFGGRVDCLKDVGFFLPQGAHSLLPNIAKRSHSHCLPFFPALPRLEQTAFTPTAKHGFRQEHQPTLHKDREHINTVSNRFEL